MTDLPSDELQHSTFHQSIFLEACGSEWFETSISITRNMFRKQSIPIDVSSSFQRFSFLSFQSVRGDRAIVPC